MSVIGEFTVETRVMKEARDRVPEMVFEIVEIHTCEGEPVNALIWARNDDFDRLEDGMSTDPTVAEYDTVADLGNRRLYSVGLTEEGQQAMNHTFTEPYDVIVLDATIRQLAAEVRGRFTDVQALKEYQLFCEDRGISFSLQRTFVETTHDEVLSEAVEDDDFGAIAASSSDT